MRRPAVCSLVRKRKAPSYLRLSFIDRLFTPAPPFATVVPAKSKLRYFVQNFVQFFVKNFVIFSHPLRLLAALDWVSAAVVSPQPVPLSSLSLLAPSSTCFLSAATRTSSAMGSSSVIARASSSTTTNLSASGFDETTVDALENVQVFASSTGKPVLFKDLWDQKEECFRWGFCDDHNADKLFNCDGVKTAWMVRHMRKITAFAD